MPRQVAIGQIAGVQGPLDVRQVESTVPDRRWVIRHPIGEREVGVVVVVGKIPSFLSRCRIERDQVGWAGDVDDAVGDDRGSGIADGLPLPGNGAALAKGDDHAAARGCDEETVGKGAGLGEDADHRGRPPALASGRHVERDKPIVAGGEIDRVAGQVRRRVAVGLGEGPRASSRPVRWGPGRGWPWPIGVPSSSRVRCRFWFVCGVYHEQRSGRQIVTLVGRTVAGTQAKWSKAPAATSRSTPSRPRIASSGRSADRWTISPIAVTVASIWAAAAAIFAKVSGGAVKRSS